MTYLMRLVLAGALLLPATAWGAELTGKPRVIDGDTLGFGVSQVDLFSVKAPREDETCDDHGKVWACGREAADALAYLSAEHWITCKLYPRYGAKHPVAVCKTGPLDLGAEMVRQGWAKVGPPFVPAYLAAEVEARKAKRGIWRGD